MKPRKVWTKRDRARLARKRLWLRQHAPHDLRLLCDEVLWRWQKFPRMYPFHVARAQELDADRNAGRHSINIWARGLLKTTMVMIARNIQQNLLYPHSTHLLRHWDDAEVLKPYSEIVSHYTQNPIFRFIWPEHAVPKGKKLHTKEGFTTPARAFYQLPFRREPTFAPMGLQSTSQGGHYDFASDDDIEIDKSVATDVLRDKLEAKWSDTAALLNPRRQLPSGLWVGVYTLTGTIWHDDGLHNRILKNLAGHHSYQFHFHPARLGQTEAGKPVCPEVLSEEKLKEKRATSTDYYTYSCNYLLKAAYKETGAFQPNQWPRYPKPPERKSVACRVLTIDPAYTANRKNDPSALLVVDILADDTWVVLCAWRVWDEPHELVRRIWDLSDEYRPDVIYVEQIGAGMMIGKDLAESQAEKGRYLPIEGIKSHTRASKADREKKGKERIGVLKTRAAKGRLALYQNGYGMADLIQEFEAYPYGRYDDLMDALTTIEEQTPPKRPVEKEAEQPAPGSLEWLLAEEEEEEMGRFARVAGWRRDPQAVNEWLQERGRQEFGI